MKTLKERIQEAFPELTDADFDKHGYRSPDLYVRSVPGLWEWLQNNHEFPKLIKMFTSDIPPYVLWIEIPFYG